MVLVAFLTHKKTVVKIFQRRCFNLGLPKSFYIWDPKTEQITWITGELQGQEKRLLHNVLREKKKKTKQVNSSL